MVQVIQCVPNFSEGRRVTVVTQIVDAIRAAGAEVIDYSLDTDHNRSVVTFIGDPERIYSGVMAGAGKAAELIDLRAHQGAHPRIGAMDVVPLVPVTGVTMDDCVRLSHRLGKAIADNLDIPVYLYEKSASAEHRQNLANVRRGGFEGIAGTTLSKDREPDFGPHRAHPSAGATVIGARGPLIAFNVNLRSHDMALARRIASNMRRTRDEGKGLPGVKAIAVELVSRKLVQISTNITEPDKATMYDVFEFVRREAERCGTQVLESELIGVVRSDAVARSAASAMALADFGSERILDNHLPSG